MAVQILNWRTGAVIATVNAENLIDVDFGGWNLTDADFTDQNCRYADFSGANLTDALFVRALLGAADLDDTNQEGTDFTDADFSLPSWSLKRIYYNGYSDSRVDSTVYRIEALCTDVANNLQYAIWYRQATKGLYISKQDLGTGVFTIVALPFAGESVTHATDTHCVPTLIVDGDGYVHAWFGMHAIPMQYLRSTSPGDIASMTTLATVPIAPGGGTLEDNVTYVKAVLIPDGNLLASFRNGSSTEGDEVLYHYETPSNGGAEWTIRHSVLIDGFTGNYLAYVNPLRIHPTTGRLYYGFCWNEGGFGTDRNHDVVWLQSDDFGITFERPDASAQTIPIDQTNDQVQWTIPIGSGLINITTNLWDASGNPTGANYFDPGAPGSPGFSQYCYFRWNGSSVDKRPVGPLIDFSIVTDPTVIDFPLSQPMLLLDGTREHMLMRVNEWGPGLWDIYSDDHFVTQVGPVNLCEFDFKSWAPSIDWAAWVATDSATGQPQLFCQRVTESLAEGEPSIGEQPVSVLRVQLPR